MLNPLKKINLGLIKSCEFKNFNYHPISMSLILLEAKLGSIVIIKSSKFFNSVFFHGLITNTPDTYNRENHLHYSLGDQNCKNVNSLIAGDCWKLSLIDSQFTDSGKNFKMIIRKGTYDRSPSTHEGIVLFLRGFEGSINIIGCSFK